jgi:hypothetical protein
MADNENEELRELLRLASGSKRAIDLYMVNMLARIERKIGQTASMAEKTHNVVFGGDGQLGLVQKMAIIVFIAMTLVGSWTWIWDKITGVAHKPVFGDEVAEKWLRKSTRRVLIRDPRTGKSEMFYALEEQKAP